MEQIHLSELFWIVSDLQLKDENHCSQPESNYKQLNPCPDAFNGMRIYVPNHFPFMSHQIHDPWDGCNMKTSPWKDPKCPWKNKGFSRPSNMGERTPTKWRAYGFPRISLLDSSFINSHRISENLHALLTSFSPPAHTAISATLPPRKWPRGN